MKIIIANNSVILRNILSEILTDAGHQVIECTSSGKRVVDLALSETVDCVLLGQELSEYLEEDVVKKIGNKTHIVLIGKNKELLKLGAVNIIDKPTMEQVGDKNYIKEFINIINSSVEININGKNNNRDKSIKHIVIGSSTGGPNALKEILGDLPANFPVPISIVQHLEEGHEEGLASWLKNNCKLNVRVAIDNDLPKPGDVILGVQNKHLTVNNGRYYLTNGEKVNFQKPAIDVQFSTASNYYRENLLGVLLTGMGSDGAKGCLDIINNGGITVVQDEESSTVYGMPKVAAELGAASIILPLNKIAKYIIDAVSGSGHDI